MKLTKIALKTAAVDAWESRINEVAEQAILNCNPSLIAQLTMGWPTEMVEQVQSRVNEQMSV